MLIHHASRFAAALALLALAGCPQASGPTQPAQPGAGQSVVEQAATAEDWQRDMERLRALGAAYHARLDATGNPPASWEELKQGSPQAQAFAELEAEGWVVAWGTHPRDVTQGSSEFVLAYSPTGQEQEGYILNLDGSVMRMPPEELKAKLAAQTPAPATP